MSDSCWKVQSKPLFRAGALGLVANMCKMPVTALSLRAWPASIVPADYREAAHCVRSESNQAFLAAGSGSGAHSLVLP